MKYLVLMLVLIGTIYALDIQMVENYSTEELGELKELWMYNGNLISFSVKKHSILTLNWSEDEQKWEILNRLGSSDSTSDKYIGNADDIWIDGDILYVLDGREIKIFNMSSRRHINTLQDEPFIQKSPTAIAVYGDYLYIADTESDSITVAKCYDKKKMKFIASGVLNYAYLNDFNANFNDPYDIFITTTGLLYVLDMGSSSIKVFNITDDYSYVKDFASSDKYINLIGPKKIYLDNDYLYVVNGLDDKIQIIFDNEEKVVFNLTNFSYIKGIYSNNSHLFVYDVDKDQIFVFYVNRTSKLSEGDIIPLYDMFMEKNERLCTLKYFSEVYDDLKISELCGELTDIISEYNNKMNDAKYDEAYYLIKDEGMPKVEGGLSYYPRIISQRLDDNLDDIRSELLNLNELNLTGVPKTNLLNLWDMYKKARSYYKNESYWDSYVSYKEILVKLRTLKLDLLQEDKSEGDSGVKTSESAIKLQYRERFDQYQKRFNEIKPKMIKYNIKFNTLFNLLEDAQKAIDSDDYDRAYEQLGQLSKLILQYESQVKIHESRVNIIKKALKVVEEDINETSKMSFLMFKPDLSKAVELYNKAKSTYVVNPTSAKNYLETASKEIVKARKNYDDKIFMIELIVVLLVFIIILVLVVSLAFYLHKKRKRDIPFNKQSSKPPRWRGWNK